MKTIPGRLFGVWLAGELPAVLAVKQVLTRSVAKKTAAAAEAEALKRGSMVVSKAWTLEIFRKPIMVDGKVIGAIGVSGHRKKMTLQRSAPHACARRIVGR
jgi:hypothetical protein